MVVSIRLCDTTSVTPERLWALLSDHENYAKWGPWQRSSLDRPGTSGKDGVGAVRRLRVNAGSTMVERIVVYDPPHHLAYELLSGLPLRNYRADVFLREEPGGGTLLEWNSRFEPRVFGTGWFFRALLQRAIRHVMTALFTYAGSTTRL